MIGWVTLLALTGTVFWLSRPHSPERDWAVREWLSVLRVRFANASFAWFARGEERYEDDEEADVPVERLADGVFASHDHGRTAHKVAAPVVTASEYRQIGRPALLNPPVRPQGGTTRSRVAAWIKEARAAGGLSNAEINKQAAQRFGVSLRLAQLAARDAGRGTR